MVKAAHPRRCWLRLTPDWLPTLLLVVVGLLWLSNRLHWPAWHKGYAVLVAVAVVGIFIVLMLTWWALALAFRVRFQFSIHAFLVLIVAVGVEMRRAREQRAAVSTIESVGNVSYDFQTEALKSGLYPDRPPAVPEWLLGLCGGDLFSTVDTVVLTGPQVGDAELVHLKGVSQIDILDLFGTHVSDAGLMHLCGLSQLILWTYVAPKSPTKA